MDTGTGLNFFKSMYIEVSQKKMSFSIGVVLVQEPWLHKGNISGLRTCGECSSAVRPDVRACILVKGVRCDVWAKHCGRDLATVVIHYGSKESIEKRLVVCSAYFPDDTEELPPPNRSGTS